MDLIKSLESMNKAVMSLCSVIGEPYEDLNKALDRTKLVQKQVQVMGKNGVSYSRNQWVRVAEAPAAEEPPKQQVSTPMQNTNQTSEVQSSPRKKATGVPDGFNLEKFKQDITAKKQEYLKAKEDAASDPSKEGERKKVGKELVAMQKQADKMGLPDDILSVKPSSNPTESTQQTKTDNEPVSKPKEKLVVNQNKPKEVNAGTHLKNLVNRIHNTLTSENSDYYRYDEHLNRDSDQDDRGMFDILDKDDRKHYESILGAMSIRNPKDTNVYKEKFSDEDIPKQELEHKVKREVLDRYLSCMAESKSEHADIPSDYLAKVKNDMKLCLGSSVKIPLPSSSSSKTPPKKSVKPDESKSKESQVKPETPKFDFMKDFKTKGGSDAKEYVANLQKEHGKEKVMKMAKDAGIQWAEHDHAGVNWMRASMALKHHISSGGTETSVPKVVHEQTARQQRNEVNRGTIDELVHEHGREGVMKIAKESGVKWTEDSEHPGINWMRCSMAMNKHLKNGGTIASSQGKTVEPPKRVYKEKPIKYGSDLNKNKVLKLREKYSKEEIINKAKEAGVTWREDSHEGVNWMRCSMALAKHFKDGGELEKPSQSKPTKETTKTSAPIESSNTTDKYVGKEYKIGDKVFSIKSKNSYGKYIVTMNGVDKEISSNQLRNFLKKQKAQEIDNKGELTGQSFVAGHQRYEIKEKTSDGRYKVDIRDANGKLIDTQPFHKKALKTLINKTTELENDKEVVRKVDPKEEVSKIKGDQQVEKEKDEEIDNKLKGIFGIGDSSAKKESAIDSHIKADNQEMVNKIQAEFEKFPSNPSKKYVSEKVNKVMSHSGSNIKSVLEGATAEFDKYYKGIMRQVPFSDKDNRTVKCEKLSDSTVKLTVDNGKKTANLSWDFATNKPSTNGISHTIKTDSTSKVLSSVKEALDHNNNHWKALINKGTPEFNRMYKYLISQTVDTKDTKSDTSTVKVTKGDGNTATFGVNGTKKHLKFTWDFDKNSRVTNK